MKMHCELSYYNATRTYTCVIHFDTSVPYAVRVFAGRGDPQILWELRYIDGDYVYDYDTELSRVLELSTEEELFQASCVERFDVYLVKAAMNEILRKHTNNDTENCYLTLEY